MNAKLIKLLPALVAVSLVIPAVGQAREEMITTARKTTENLGDVPLAITSITADEIERAQILNVEDVASITPGLSFAEFFGQELPTPVIRGIAQVDIFGLPNVATFVDGIYVSARTGINVGFLDFERIEVVKGPVSTLYGQNAFSGAINYVTKRPGDELEVNAEITGGSENLMRGRVSVGGPLVKDWLSGRAAVSYSDFDGTYENQADIDQDIGGSRFSVFNGTLYFTPGENWDIAWNLYYEDAKIDPPAQATTAANCENVTDYTVVPSEGRDPERLQNFCGDLPKVSKNSLYTVPGDTGQDRETVRTNLRADWETRAGTWSSLTGFSRTTGESNNSGNPGAPSTLFAYQADTDLGGFFPLNTFDSALVLTTVEDEEVQDISQEFRYLSPQDWSTRWSGGIYLYQEKDKSAVATGDGVMSFTPLPDDFGAFCPCVEFFPGGGISAGFGDFIYGPWFGYSPFGPGSPIPPVKIGENKDERSQWAAYGSLEQDIGERWTLRGEARYTYDRSEFERPITVNNVTTIETASDNWDYWTWRANVDFKPTDTSMIYLSAANARKPGKLGPTVADVVDPNNPASPPTETLFLNPVDPEKNVTFELGYKAGFLDSALVMDVAFYYIKWDDIVLRQTTTEIDGMQLFEPVAIDVNAGDGTSKGMEFSLNYQIFDPLNVGFGYSYTQAKLDEGVSEKFAEFPSFPPSDATMPVQQDPNLPNYNPAGVMNGQTLPRQPENQVNFNLTWAQNFSDNWGYYIRGDVFYRSKWYVDLDNQAVIPAATTANLRLGLESDTWTIEIWSRNIGDNDEVSAAFRDVYFTNTEPDGTNNFSTIFPWRMSYANPVRTTYGLTVRARF